MPKEEWQERFDGVVEFLVMDVEGEGYYDDIEWLVTERLGYNNSEGGPNFTKWNSEMSKIQAELLREAATRLYKATKESECRQCGTTLVCPDCTDEW